MLEIDSSSIETARGRKHVKTDRVDGEKLLDLLIRYHCLGLRGEEPEWRALIDKYGYEG